MNIFDFYKCKIMKDISLFIKHILINHKNYHYIIQDDISPVYHSAHINWMKREKERLYTILSEKTTLPVHYMSIMKDVHKEAIRGITYVGEKEGKDRWQSSTETWEKRTGDCEDIAIVIYRKLRDLGFPEWSTYVCIVKEHAFAIVRPHREATNFWILDNGKITISIKKALDVLQYYDYTPLYVFNEKSMWSVFTREIG